MFPAGAIVQIVGEPGMLKSFYAMDAGLSIAAGQSMFFGYPVVTHGPVVYIAAEGAGAFQYRVRAWCAAHDVNPLTIPFRVIPQAVDFRDPTFQAELLAIIKAVRPVLIIADTLSRCAPGAEENSATEMGEVISFCGTLQQPCGSTVAFVHHPPKHDPKGGGRGSGTIFGAIDTEMRITSDDEDGELERTILITCAKQKDDQRFPPLTLLGSVVPVHDEYGRPMAHDTGRAITSIVLRQQSTPGTEEAAEKAAAIDLEIDLTVLRVMRDHPEATNHKKLRDYAGLNQAAVDASVGRILRAGWAVPGKRGAPFEITLSGEQMLSSEVPF